MSVLTANWPRLSSCGGQGELGGILMETKQMKEIRFFYLVNFLVVYVSLD